MVTMTVTDKKINEENLLYIQTAISDLLTQAGCRVERKDVDDRAMVTFKCDECYSDIVRAEIADKIAEVIAIKYKYKYFKSMISVGGLKSAEKELLLASLIAADLEEDKKYAFDRVKVFDQVAIDGVYNFRLKPLHKKWYDITTYIPTSFISSQLKEFVTFLHENKRKRVYIDGGKVYDQHYRRLKRSLLLDGEQIKIVREVLLSNCGEIELVGRIPEEDEYYLREFYDNKIIFSSGLYE